MDALKDIVEAVGEIIDNDYTSRGLFDDVDDGVTADEAKSSRDEHILDGAHAKAILIISRVLS